MLAKEDLFACLKIDLITSNLTLALIKLLLHTGFDLMGVLKRRLFFRPKIRTYIVNSSGNCGLFVYSAHFRF